MKVLLPNLDIIRLFVKAGLLPPLSSLLSRWIRIGDEPYQSKVVDLFVQLAHHGDEAVLNAFMATPTTLDQILTSVDEMSHLPHVLLKLLHVVCRLAMCPSAAMLDTDIDHAPKRLPPSSSGSNGGAGPKGGGKGLNQVRF